MPWVAERWLGGTLTNFRTIRSRLARLDELEREVADGTALEYGKKMRSSRAREMRKITRNLDGIRKMEKLPKALVVIDVHRERNAVREARNLQIPTICLIDTDSDPDYADLPIPGNDDAMRAIELVLSYLADAIEEGLRGRQVVRQEEPPPRRDVPAVATEIRKADMQPVDAEVRASEPVADTVEPAMVGESETPPEATPDPAGAAESE